MTIAVDFDGTIVEHRYPAIGKERPFAIESLKRLAEKGHKLILWTSREGKELEDAVNFCRERGLEFYAVNSDGPLANFEGATVARKLRVDMFIDDRNLGGLPEWPTIYEMITLKMNYGDIIRRAYANDEEDDDDNKSFIKRLVERCHESREKIRKGTLRRSIHHW